MESSERSERTDRAEITEKTRPAGRSERSERAARAARAAKKKKRRRMRKIKKIWNGITTVLLAIALVFAILIWGLRLVGMDVYIVQSGSMEPELHVGALVYVSKVDTNELAAGDIITYRLSDGETLSTHRIIEVVQENGAPAFRTKGDANEFEDSNLVASQSVVGKVRFSIPELGYFVTNIQQPPGTYYAFCVVAGLLVLTILPDILFEEVSSNKKKGKKGTGSKKKSGSAHRSKSEITAEKRIIEKISAPNQTKQEDEQ